MIYTFESVKVDTSVRPAAAAAGAINGGAIDTKGFGDAVVAVSVGATTGTPTSFTVAAKVQESADGSTGWVDVADAAITAITAANKTAEMNVLINARAASLRYIRAVVTPAFVAGTSPTVGVSAVVLLGRPARGSKASNSGVGN